MHKLPDYLVFSFIVFFSLLIFVTLGNIPLSTLNEGRRALVVQEMFHQHTWLLPTLNGQLYLSKPPLFYWIALCFSHLWGTVSEWSVRLPSAIAAILLLWLTFVTGKKYFNVFVAMMATILLCANLEFAQMARRAEIEMLLSLFCMSAWICFIQYIQTRRQSMLIFSYVLLALAVMSKGPVALLFVSLPALVYGLLCRDRLVIKYFSHVLAWIIFLLIAGIWYWLVSMRLGFDIWDSVIQKDMVEKIQSTENAKPWLGYLGWILIDFFGLIMVLFWRSHYFIQHIKQNRPAMIMLIGALVPLLIFSLFSNKHDKYLLPIYPLLALLVAWQISLIAQYARARFAQWMLALGFILLSSVSLFYVLFEQHYFDYRFSALRDFSQWHIAFREVPIVSLESLDSRLIFYTGKPISVVKMGDLQTLSQRQKSILVISEHTPILFDNSVSPCTMRSFRPYLKKSNTLYVYGLGNICQQGVK